MRYQDSLYPDFEFPDKPTVRKRGHAGQPGNGPDGETCKTCKHYTLKRMAKTYRKCGLNKANWTGGPGSDIRAGDPACDFWEVKEDE